MNSNGTVSWNFDTGYINGFFGYVWSETVVILDLRFTITIIGAAVNSTTVCASSRTAADYSSSQLGGIVGTLKYSVFSIDDSVFTLY